MKNMIHDQLFSYTVKKSTILRFAALIWILLCVGGCRGPGTEELKMLILTGRNNHDREKTTAMLAKAGSFIPSLVMMKQHWGIPVFKH